MKLKIGKGQLKTPNPTGLMTGLILGEPAYS